MDADADSERLIDVCLDVCARQGYDKITLADIATTAGVSEEALARQFATKESIVMSPVDAMLDAVVVALADIDAEVDSVDALQAAHAKVLNDIIEGVGPISRERMQAMGTAVMYSDELQERTYEHRAEILGDVLAERLKVDKHHPRVKRAITMWSAVVAATYVAAPDRHGRFDPDEDARRPHRMRERLAHVFTVITGRL
jgi:AcrR family transcriptional regulator